MGVGDLWPKLVGANSSHRCPHPSLIADGKDSTALSALPRSVPFTTFQKLESASSNEDFLEMAADYATHAGAARDLIKLAKLGREGENGSEELVAVYATRAADEIKEANLILQVLAASL